MNYPLPVKKGVKVKYFDRISREELVFPESNDLVIANHFIEHCPNPIRTLENI